MHDRRTLGVGRVRAPIATVAGIACAVVFVVVAGNRVAPATFGAVALITVALAAGALLGGAAAQTGSLRVVGAFVAIVAAWLLPQRADAGTIAIIAAFFGAGLALLVGPLHPSAARPGSRGWHRALAAALLVATVMVAAYVGAETPDAHWFGGGITHGPTATRAVALTFDDGPNVTATLPIMRILDAAHVKGTFFEVGKAIDSVPQITRTLAQHGQLLGNHSYEHDQWRWLDPRYPEVERTQQAFARAIGKCPAYYRPPHGDRTPFVAHVVSDHHMRIVMWNDSSHDWAETNPHTIARRVVERARPGSIIVLHDGLDGNPAADRTVLVKAMPLIVDGLRAKHFEIVGLDQLIGGPAYVPC